MKPSRGDILREALRVFPRLELVQRCGGRAAPQPLHFHDRTHRGCLPVCKTVSKTGYEEAGLAGVPRDVNCRRCWNALERILLVRGWVPPQDSVAPPSPSVWSRTGLSILLSTAAKDRMTTASYEEGTYTLCDPAALPSVADTDLVLRWPEGDQVGQIVFRSQGSHLRATAILRAFYRSGVTVTVVDLGGILQRKSPC